MHSIRFIALVLLGCVACSAAVTRPNIIVVMTDDQGYGDLSCHGNPMLQTPNLDAFHRQSVRFTEFMVSPTCAPTRSALMTGRHEFFNGVTHTIYERERLTTNAVTIAELLRRAGYATGIFGKWHLGDEPAYWPDKRGFGEMFIHGAGGIGQSYPGSCGDAPSNSYFNPVILHNGRFVKTKGYCTDVFFGQAAKWIDERRGSKEPFLAFITPNAPHAPLDCPPEYQARYAGKVGTNVAKFFGMIANIDDNFGRLMAKLREWNLETNTLVVFMTDNGGTVGVQTWNAGMRGQKVTAWRGGTRVPSFWRWPTGFRGGVDCDRLTAHIDVFRTLAEISGTAIPAALEQQVHGRSLLPLLKNPSGEWEDRTLVTHVGRWEFGKAAESKYANCSIRNARFQLISPPRGRNAPAGHRWELYDLKTDPAQKTNVIESHANVVKQLELAYDQWWSDVQPYLVNENVSGPKENPFHVLYREQGVGALNR